MMILIIISSNNFTGICMHFFNGLSLSTGLQIIYLYALRSQNIYYEHVRFYNY